MGIGRYGNLPYVGYSPWGSVRYTEGAISMDFTYSFMHKYNPAESGTQCRADFNIRRFLLMLIA
jgi:hypothetical protein